MYNQRNHIKNNNMRLQNQEKLKSFLQIIGYSNVRLSIFPFYGSGYNATPENHKGYRFKLEATKSFPQEETAKRFYKEKRLRQGTRFE